MNNVNLVVSLGIGSLAAFLLFAIFFKLLRWGGKMSALATAGLMLLGYVPLAITNWAGLDVFAIHFAFFMMIPYGLGIITGVQDERRMREGENHQKTGMHWIPALIIVFFIFLAVVDSIIISFATAGLNSNLAKILLPERASEDVGKTVSSQFTGAVSNDHQDEEKRFDKYVAKLQKQRERGWKISGGWTHPPVVNKESVFKLNAKTKDSESINGAKVTVEFRRASDMSFDKLYNLRETGSGVYSAPVTLPLAGCWDMKILAVKNEDEHEIQGQSEISTMVDGKLITPECLDGEPDVDDIPLR